MYDLIAYLKFAAKLERFPDEVWAECSDRYRITYERLREIIDKLEQDYT